jgi:hypothetical protein
MIVFEYAESALSGDEGFLPDELPEDEPPLPMLPPSFGDPAIVVDTDVPVAIDDAEFTDEERLEILLSEELEELPSHILQTQLKVLDPEQHAMTDIYDKLVELDAYKPIMRVAWTQATFERDQTLPIHLRRLGDPPLRLDGILMLYLSRYLHLVVDLALESETAPPASPGDGLPRYYGDARTPHAIDYDYARETAPVRYRIAEDRIFRNGELRYYDHPRFGVLARITRFEEQALDTDELFLLPGELPAEDSARSDNR